MNLTEAICLGGPLHGQTRLVAAAGGIHYSIAAPMTDEEVRAAMRGEPPARPASEYRTRAVTLTLGDSSGLVVALLYIPPRRRPPAPRPV